METNRETDSSSPILEIDADKPIIIKLKDSQWKELKSTREEGLKYQSGTSLLAFAISSGIGLWIANDVETYKVIILSFILGGCLFLGVFFICSWIKEKGKRDSLILRIESKVRDKYGDSVDL